MAEWLSTEFFHHVVTAPRGSREQSNSSFRHIQASLADSTQHVSGAAKDQQHSEDHAEQQFGSEEFTHEINLKEEKYSQPEYQSLAQFRLCRDASRSCL
jgi:hypothetical protein